MIKLVTTTHYSGYVRRYIVSSLENRTIENRRELFIKLITDENVEVRVFVKHWYIELEDEFLRDQLLEVFDATSNQGLRIDILKTIGYSKLQDTGSLLYIRLNKNEYTKEVCKWLYRALASLNYKKSYPKLIETLKNDPFSNLSQHILIAIADKKIIEAMPVLFDMVKNLNEGYESIWLARAFYSLATADDRDQLIKIASKSPSNTVIHFCAITLAESRDKKYSDFIRKAISNPRLTLIQRRSILHEWEMSLSTERIDSFSVRSINARQAQDKLSSDEIKFLYTLLKSCNLLSTISLGMLINFETDIRFLADTIMFILPKLKTKFSHRQVSLININNLKELSNFILPWLNRQLMSQRWPKNYIHNLLELAGLIGNVSTHESILSNKERIVKAVNESMVQAIERSIRRSNGQVRLGY